MNNFVSEKIKMKSNARLAFVQATYMAEFAQNPIEEVLQDFLNDRVGRFVIEENQFEEEQMLEVGEMDKEYFVSLVNGLCEHKADILNSMNVFLKEGRNFEHFDATMRSLLMCAAYELVYTTDVDVKVIIQEYVDLAYAFFSKNEPKVINAILDQIAKEVR